MVTSSSEPRGLAQVVDRALTGPAILVGLLVVLSLTRFAYIFVYINPQTASLGVAQRAIVTSYTGMLDQETGLRGYMATGDAKYLAPYTQGRQEVATGTSLLRGVARSVGLDQSAQRLVASQDAWTLQWARHAALGAIDSDAFLTVGKNLFDAYRAVEEAAAGEVSSRQVVIGNESVAALYLSLTASVVLAAAFGMRWARSRQVLLASVVAPIDDLRADLRRMASGDLSPTTAPHGPAEIQEIALALRDTAESLATARRGLVDDEHRLSQILDSLPVGVFVVDAAGMTVYANQRSTQLLGRGIDTQTKLEGLQQVYRTYRAGTDDPYPYGELPLGRALKGEASQVEDLEVRAPGGTTLVAVSGAPLRSGDGDIVGAVAALMDITEIHAARDLMQERSLELERSNSELEQFAYVASHDLQEPLRMVTSYVQLIEHRYRDLLDDDGREFIGFVVDGATRMQALISGLLAYSKVGRHGAPLVAADVTSVLQGVTANLSKAVAERNAEVSIGPMPHRVLGDVVQLTQVFQNLIGNALKFCTAGTPRIAVTAEAHAGLWQFQVADNGIGIEPEHRERVFQMFQRLNTRTAYPGTGIGLAICQRIVERHGGTIWIEAGEGGGTSFFFTLRSATMAPHDVEHDLMASMAQGRGVTGFHMEGDDAPGK